VSAWMQKKSLHVPSLVEPFCDVGITDGLKVTRDLLFKSTW
jgi:hypothetical protein